MHTTPIALFGYLPHNGHSTIGHSAGLVKADLSALVNKSDYTGYVPHKATPVTHIAAWPLRDRYVVSAYRPDISGPRLGCVTTASTVLDAETHRKVCNISPIVDALTNRVDEMTRLEIDHIYGWSRNRRGTLKPLSFSLEACEKPSGRSIGSALEKRANGQAHDPMFLVWREGVVDHSIELMADVWAVVRKKWRTPVMHSWAVAYTHGTLARNKHERIIYGIPERALGNVAHRGLFPSLGHAREHLLKAARGHGCCGLHPYR